ncbi:Uncharacterised protein [Bordetella pertussis]|nr:Uncharacterised protein [Bordetella pertussis]
MRMTSMGWLEAGRHSSTFCNCAGRPRSARSFSL